MTNGRVIAFEGVDGAGKSTALALVADRLRQRGVRVFLPRFGKDHASPIVRSIRDITRDRGHMQLDARAELLLYCAREAQVLAELVRPALQSGQTVLVDRSLLTAEVLGRARGLSPRDCESAVAAAAAGTAADLTLVFDVHPRTSKLRKRLERIRTHSEQRGGRKGLAGTAFKEGVRDLYLQLAAQRGYPVLHAERATPEVLALRALALIDHGPLAATGESELDRTPHWLVAPELDFPQALQSLPLTTALLMSSGLICGRDLRRSASDQEPALCAYTMDFEDPLRAAIAPRQPEYSLRGRGGQPLSGPEDLRVGLLDRAPAACIAALKHLSDAESDRIRERYAEELPDAVLSSLAFREDERAQELRERCFRKAGDRARAATLQGCTGEIAWSLRERLFERDVVYGLQSLRGVAGPRAQELLERHAAAAPATVIGALTGRSDEPAYRLRDDLFATGREVIDSVRGLDDEDAWRLRERGLERWPATVAHSLLHLSPTPRVRALAKRCAALGAGEVQVLRRLQGLAEQPNWPAWVKARRTSAYMELESVDNA
jgi:dTMP kinase